MTDLPRHYASSAELCAAVLAEHGPAVALSFSCGKDAVAAWLQLRARGFTRVVPFYMYLLPDLEFVERGIKYYEKVFETPILRVPACLPALCVPGRTSHGAAPFVVCAVKPARSGQLDQSPGRSSPAGAGTFCVLDRLTV